MKRILFVAFLALTIIGCGDEKGEAITMAGLNPEFEIVSPAEQDTLRTSLTINLSVSWPISIETVNGSLNSSSFSYEYSSSRSIDISDLKQGLNTLKISIRDYYGNFSETKTRTFYYFP